MTDTTPDSAFYFNAGSDARLAGVPVRICPFVEGPERWNWIQGWRDVDRFWGVWARGSAKPLPEVKQ